MPRAKSDLVQIRTSKDEKQRFKRAARNAGRTLGDWMRVVCLAAAARGELALPKANSEQQPEEGHNADDDAA